MFSFGSVLRLLLGSNNNEVVFSLWSVPRLLQEEEEVLSQRLTKVAIYWTSQPELQKDKVVKSRPA
jgi:hypothetical protein